jgi:TetR/AcrR family transcriptional repressor of nem operon
MYEPLVVKKNRRLDSDSVRSNSPGSGCVRAALGPELARKPLSVRKRIETLLEAYRERLSPFFPGQTQEKRLAKCRLLFPSMAGVLMMVRASPDPQTREDPLASRATTSTADIRPDLKK